MAIFSSFIKSAPQTPTIRAVPNGGLGGFVQLDRKEQNSTKTENEIPAAETKSTRQRKQPPPPILLNNVDIGAAPAQSAPLGRDDDRSSPAALWKISHPPLKTAIGTAFVVTDDEIKNPQSLFSKILWSTPVGRQASEKTIAGSPLTSTLDVQKSKLPSPVELPGSLLLPDQGFSHDDKPASPSTPTKRPRAYTDRSPVSPSKRRSDPNAIATHGMDAVKAVLRNHKVSKPFRSANNSQVSTPTHENSPPLEMLMNANINTLSAEDLIRVMPKMKAKKLATDWFPAMEKEIGKYKGLLHQYSNRIEVNGRHLNSIYVDLRHLLGIMKSSGYSCKQFEKAQADIDDQKRTDIEKLQHAEEELQQAWLVCEPKTGEIDIATPEYQQLKYVLYRAVATLGDCIRSNLAYKLYHSHEGLSEEAVKILRAYKQWDDHTLKTLPSLVPVELYESARQMAVDLERRLSATHDMSIDLDECREQWEAQRTRAEELQAENLALKEQIRVLRMAQSSTIESRGPDSATIRRDSAHDDLTTVLSHHEEELEERSSIINKQNAIIEDLMQQVDAMEGKHILSKSILVRTTSTTRPSSFVSETSELDRSDSGAERKKPLGIRTLSKAIIPIARGMSHLRLSHHEDMNAEESSHYGEEQSLFHHRHKLTKSRPHQSHEDQPYNEQSQEVHDDNPYHATHTPNPNQSPVQQLDQQRISSTNEDQKPYTKPENRNDKNDTRLIQPRNTSLGRRVSTSAFPSIASRLYANQPKHKPGPIRHGKAIIQGMRNDQIPLRMIANTVMKPDREHRRSKNLMDSETETSSIDILIDSYRRSQVIAETEANMSS